MKKSGILNRDITAVLAQMGHTDTIVIADCGLPIPKDITCIDLSLKLGEPDFLTVLETVMEDFVAEEMTLAEEIKQFNVQLYSQIHASCKDIPKNFCTHEELKQELNKARAVIRTGEATPFANAILKSGVIF